MRWYVLLVLLLVSAFAWCQNPVQETLDRFQDSIPYYGIAALVDDGNMAHSGAIGVSHDDQPLTTSHRFCIGSCTKMFTATLILMLHERGQLRLDDPLHQYLQPFQLTVDSTISIRQLLQHTSGIGDFAAGDFVNTPLLFPHADYSDTRLLKRADTTLFPKGTRYSYSNTNFLLLRKIIEVVTDRPYELALMDYLLNPLDLTNTFPYYSNQIEHLAHPIIGKQDLHDIPKLGSNTISRGVGNIVSDLADVNTFLRALLIDRSLLKPETLALMLVSYEDEHGKVGLGLFYDDWSGSELVGHLGRQVSYISYAYVNVETGTSYVVLNNNANDTVIDRVFESLVSKRP